jgi:hypothetical protein
MLPILNSEDVDHASYVPVPAWVLPHPLASAAFAS